MQQVRLAIATLALGAVALAAPPLSPELGRSARHKIERIENGQTNPGETIVFTEAEINSLLRYEYASEMPEGVRDPSVRITADNAVVHAWVDIARMQEAAGDSLSGLWALLFSGEKELNAACRPESLGDGREGIKVEMVQFGGATLPTRLVDWLIAATVSDEEVGSGNPVALPDNLREVRLEAERAIVVMD